ncbi:carboxymuconolactone decarboxylase [Chryseobacterium aquaticum]|uniref:Carboxymuconolactone decarboxylase n=1 Tax=Chryseobacterium aquaticum TaxID=452084 RepID=A0A848N407_9FLAO|nr:MULTISPECIES: carboxymuconolactone decarboxylase family protein [Chryseobacterium]NMR33231.1 carboxymuconolactone decarboxylase [Chryseobacterium aquaticum]NRQ44837.1 carboxymuconolactone decarboxylase family protein [Chryseobacterium sp. C-204]
MKKIQFTVVIVLLTGISLFFNHLKAQQMTGSNSELNSKEKSIIKISSYTAQGKLTELKMALSAGLDSGLTINEIKEMLVHSYAYCGFPRSIRGLQTFMEVVEERKAKGIKDNTGAEASQIADDKTKYERGKKTLGELTGTPQPDKLSGYSAFAPAIDTFLKEHLFADIFERDILSFKQRELVTISIITAIGDADPMLQSHLELSLNVGWSPEELNEFVTVITPTISTEKSTAAAKVLKEVLKNRKSK